MKLFFVALTGLAIMPALLMGQEHKSVPLPDLLNRIEQKAPSLIADSALIAVRSAEARETAANWLPDLKLNFQANIGSNNNTAGPYFGYGIIPSNSRGVRAESNHKASLTNLGIAAVDWEFYNFGAYAAQRRSARLGIDLQKEQYNLSRYELQQYGIMAYLSLARLENLRTIQLKNIARNEEVSRSIFSLARSGVKAGVDTSIVLAELSKARLNDLELKNQIKQVQLQLAAISDMPYKTILADTTLDTRLVALQKETEPAVTDTGKHPLAQYYKMLYKNNLQKEDVVRKSYNPKLMFEAAVWGRGSSITANDQFNALNTGWGFDRSNYLVGIGISYNLFDIKRRQLKLNTSRQNSDYALKRLHEQQNDLLYTSSQADAELETAMGRLQEIPNQLRAADAAYRQKMSLYKNGLTDIIELNTALQTLYRAETDAVQARYLYSRALFQRALVQNRLGNLLQASH